MAWWLLIAILSEMCMLRYLAPDREARMLSLFGKGWRGCAQAGAPQGATQLAT